MTDELMVEVLGSILIFTALMLVAAIGWAHTERFRRKYMEKELAECRAELTEERKKAISSDPDRDTASPGKPPHEGDIGRRHQ
ncbi:hypothetical protein [Planotetraspora kaengkrachanensis]|uniref:Uncharacterized protein n=1 Tax=Planotetraspora kaengkrachanensis TaxID=575193 RepID=A0A8J3VC21_9ACTN|nr:hypothetical protein [Planotetraspora kaengkrachanensis]GIG84089.1 hypothetical protein Pka01_72160 [Planotetraspora kaengkrachanensis]